MNANPVTLKSFQPGQTVYIVNIELLEYRKPKSSDQIIVETTVDKIGRKYATVGYKKFFEDPEAKYGKDGLIEQVTYGYPSILTPNLQNAQNITRRIQLTQQILSKCDANRLKYLSLDTLEQLNSLLTT